MITDEVSRARTLVQTLLASGLTHAAIAEALGGRISSRTVYRWAKGESAPQRRSDLIALEHLAKSLSVEDNGVA
jgi:transcriptional regulator with XRE-family HTH domain